MRILAIAVVVVGANSGFGLASPRIAAGLTPRTATRLISLVGFATTLATGFVLSVVCFDFLAQLPPVAAAEAWSTTSLNLNAPIPLAVGLLASPLVLGAALRASARLTRVTRDLWASLLTARALDPVRGDVVVVNDDHPDAYALPGIWGGRVVVTSAMLSALDPDETRALLAHEDSHLRHHHHLYIALADLAAAANPLIGSVPHVVRRAVERWADEDAAHATGDRRLAARSVARAGLASLRTPRTTRAGVALAMANSPVRDRTTALLAPAPRTQPHMVALVLAVVLLTSFGTYRLAHLTAHRYEQARAAYLQR
jgi:beta-lactamase regulating signal transducer with metallopeptidase domain